jgi:Protein of unknown function (DUF1573)
MKKPIYRSSTVLIFNLWLMLGLVGRGLAELRWEAAEQTFQVKPATEEVKAVFRFQNNGSAPVTINEVKTSCGCTTAALAKKEYAPGEAGEIVANFHVAGRTGHQQKKIFVSLSGETKPSVLSLVVDIPELVKIEPEFVVWQVGEKAETKTIHVSASEDVPVRIASVTTDNPALQVTVREIKPGKEVNLELKPSNTSQPQNAVLLVRTDYPAENPQTRYAYARVK